MDPTKMKRMPAIKTVMTPFPYSIDIDRSAAQAEQMMLEHDFGHLPVIENGELVGVLSKRDIEVARSGRAEGDGPTVRSACSVVAYVVELSEPLDRVLAEMARKHLNAALVVKDGRLAGIFTATDACSHFGDLLRSVFPTGNDDRAA